MTIYFRENFGIPLKVIFMAELNDDIHQWKLSDGNIIGVTRIEISDLMKNFSEFSEPILQIGSKSSILDKHGGKWRNLFKEKHFIGIDIENGENVDCVFDISDKISKLRKETGIKQFSTIICHHVLEHVKNPFIAADNIKKLLRPKGKIIVTVPWVQGFHEFPDDYWRISFSGLKELFDGFEIIDEYYSDPSEKFGYRLTYNGAIEHSIRTCRIERNLFQLLLEEIPEQDMFDEYEDKKIKLSTIYMPAMSVNMIMKKN